MNPSNLNHRSLWSLDTLSSADVSALLDMALALKQAALAGQPQRPLRGKNIAVMSESPDTPALQDFTAAANALGAQVAHIKPSSSRLTQPGNSHDTTALLGRLYDAIECEGLPMSLVQEVERGTGRPVFNGVAEASHPLRVLADLMTMREHSGKPLNKVSLYVVGNGESPACDAWLQSAALTGLDLSITCPLGHRPEPARLARARKLADDTGAHLHLLEPGEPAPSQPDFKWNEHTGTRCPDGRVELACSCNGPAEPLHSSLGPDQVANQKYALQALLCTTVA